MNDCANEHSEYYAARVRAASCLELSYYTRHSERVGQTLNNLASLSRAQGHEDRAETLLIECLSIREKVSGVVHPDTHKTAQQLINMYRQQGRTEDMQRVQRTVASWRRQGGSVDAGATWLRAQVSSSAGMFSESVAQACSSARGVGTVWC